MKKFEEAMLEVVKFSVEDIITASNTETSDELGENDLPFG